MSAMAHNRFEWLDAERARLSGEGRQHALFPQVFNPLWKRLSGIIIANAAYILLVGMLPHRPGGPVTTLVGSLTGAVLIFLSVMALRFSSFRGIVFRWCFSTLLVWGLFMILMAAFG